MGAYSRSYSFVDGEIPTETEWNVDIDGIIAVLNGQLDDANVDYTSADGIVTMARTQTISGAKTFTAASQFSSTVTVGVDDTGYDVQFFGATTGKSFLWDESADKLIVTGDFSVSGTVSDLGTVTTIDINGGTIDGVTIGGASAGAGSFTTVSAQGTVTVGVDDTGYDVQFFGATSGKSLLWDESADTLIITGAQTISETLGVTGVATFTAQSVHTGGIQSGGNIVSDTNSTDDLGTTGVRWANLYVDDITLTTTITAGTSVVANTMTLSTGSIVDSSGAISFGNENLTTTGTLSAGATTVTSLLASSNDVGAIGASGTAFSDLFLASGSVINFNAGDVTLTHSANTLAMQGGSFVIGSGTAQQAFEVKDGNIALTDTDISQPMTALIEGNAWGRIQPLSGTAGGVDFVGVSDTDATAMDFRAYIGASNPTDTTPAMRWRAGKSDGGTNIAALGASETAYQWTNFNTSTVYMSIYGGGSVVVGAGAIATTATDGFLYIPSCAGAPTGTPTDHSNLSAMVHDTTNNRFYIYDHVSNAWQYAALT